MLTVGVKKVIVDDVTAVDEEFAGALEDMDVAIVTMFPRFAWDEPPEFGRMLDDFWLCVPPSELVVFTTGTVIDF